MKKQILFMAGLMAFMAIPAGAEAPLKSYASPMRDVTLTSTIVWKDMNVLKGVSPEFAQVYRFTSTTMQYREPERYKLTAMAGLVDVTYLINGNQKAYRAGFLHRTMDIAHKPGQRQTALTVGLVSPSWVDLVNVTPLGTVKVNGQQTEAYEAHFKEEPRGTYHKLYMDPQRKYVVRMVQIHGDGKPKASFDFLDPVRKNGVWVPTKTVVYNGQGVRGAETKMEGIRVNTGIPESVFKL